MGVFPFLHGAPVSVTLTGPASGEIVSPSDMLSWLRVANPHDFDTVYYAVQIDDDSLYGSIDVQIDSIPGYLAPGNDTIAVTIAELDTASVLHDNSLYYWRVDALNRFAEHAGYTAASISIIISRTIRPCRLPMASRPPAIRRSRH